MSESLFLRHTSDRAEQFQPNPRLIELIDQLRPLLQPLQDQVNERFTAPQQPVSLVIGCPRSGTTLLTQVLAATNAFAYPSNLINRFAFSPYLGALIQKLLLDPEYDYRHELADIQSDINFESTLGRSQGALAVSEFFYFWRRFLPVFDPQSIADHQLHDVRCVALRAELASIEEAFGKPFMSKAMMLQYNIPFFAQQIPELLFVYVTRPTQFLMQSIYEARQKFYGTSDIWWSVKPSQYDQLESMDPVAQIAGQVYYTEQAIERGLALIAPERVCQIEYEQLCAAPAEIYAQLRGRYRQMGSDLPADYRGEPNFPLRQKLRLPKQVLEQMQRAYDKIQADDTSA